MTAAKVAKSVTIGELFIVPELKLAQKIWTKDRHNFHQRVKDEIVTPAMVRINATTGQENDAAYLAYALEYAIQNEPRE